MLLCFPRKQTAVGIIGIIFFVSSGFWTISFYHKINNTLYFGKYSSYNQTEISVIDPTSSEHSQLDDDDQTADPMGLDGDSHIDNRTEDTGINRVDDIRHISPVYDQITKTVRLLAEKRLDDLIEASAGLYQVI
jgi:hypothetical protein